MYCCKDSIERGNPPLSTQRIHPSISFLLYLPHSTPVSCRLRLSSFWRIIPLLNEKLRSKKPLVFHLSAKLTVQLIFFLFSASSSNYSERISQILQSCTALNSIVLASPTYPLYSTNASSMVENSPYICRGLSVFSPLRRWAANERRSKGLKTAWFLQYQSTMSKETQYIIRFKNVLSQLFSYSQLIATLPT